MPAIQVCELCNDTGWIARQGSHDAYPCTCQKDLRKQQRVAATLLPARYIHCRLANFNDRGKPALIHTRHRMQEFVDCWPGVERGAGFLLMGNCGTGKTHLATAVLQEIIDMGKPGQLLFSNFQELIQEIHASFSSEEAPSKSEILQPLLEADLLVLDELGSQKPTPFVQEVLYYVINSRYNNLKHTIFTTNYVDEPGKANEESLELRIGRQLRSRLYEMTETIKFIGDDYRREAKPHI